LLARAIGNAPHAVARPELYFSMREISSRTYIRAFYLAESLFWFFFLMV